MRYADTERQKAVTLFGLGVLHAYTHIYQVALTPLYLKIKDDFDLPNVALATLLPTIQNLVYYALSLPLGVLADRYSRKRLLTVGLALNAVGFIGLAYAPTYLWAILWLVVAGVGGSFYHPAATAMVVALYPERPGWALGRAGIGAGFGFFFGPFYTGMRAEEATWRAPCFELGVLGLIGVVAFAMTARRVRPGGTQHPVESHRLRATWIVVAFLIVSVAFALRDFTGAATATITSLFLQNAHGFDAGKTGLLLGLAFLVAMAANPILGSVSDRDRFGWAVRVLWIAAVMVVAIPWLPRAALWVGMPVYGFFMLASYPIVEAALMESVPDHVRGRVFGVFVMVGGLIASLAHWLMGDFTDRLGDRATETSAYAPIYFVLGALIIVSLVGLPLLRWARRSASGASG